MTKTLVSIVICTHRRPNLLRLAVQSLIDQTASPEGYEVIVVDNDRNPNEEVREIVKQVDPFIQVCYIHEATIGLSHARNTGGKAGQASYIGYLDDDAKVHPSYVHEVIRIIKDISPDIFGGPYYPFYLKPKPFWFLDRYGTGTEIGRFPLFLQKGRYLSGSNIFFKQELLEKVGWFDSQFGMMGKKIGYGEETMVQIKAWNANPHLKVYYHPGQYIEHLVPTRKMSLFYRLKSAFMMGNSQAYFWISENEIFSAQRNAPLRLIFLLLNLLLRTWPELALRDRCRFPYWQNYVYEQTAKYMTALGQESRRLRDLLSRP